MESEFTSYTSPHIIKGVPNRGDVTVCRVRVPGGENSHCPGSQSK